MALKRYNSRLEAKDSENVSSVDKQKNLIAKLLHHRVESFKSQKDDQSELSESQSQLNQSAGSMFPKIPARNSFLQTQQTGPIIECEENSSQDGEGEAYDVKDTFQLNIIDSELVPEGDP